MTLSVSRRLECIAEQILHGTSIVDVGTDHGYIPIYLALYKNLKRIIAMDINEGPLAKARKNIIQYNLQSQIELRLSDGLEAVKPGEVDTLIISGMGGLLMQDILEQKEDVVEKLDRMILQPQTEVPSVRKTLHNLGFVIWDEHMIYEDEKYYIIIVGVRGIEKYDHPYEYAYGKKLIEKKDPYFIRYIDEEKTKYGSLLEKLANNPNPKAKARKKEIQRIVEFIKEVQECL